MARFFSDLVLLEYMNSITAMVEDESKPLSLAS